MPKYIELRRHTDNEGDALTAEGIRAAVEIGKGLTGGYDALISSGAQRATQTLACFLAGLGRAAPAGVGVDLGFRSEGEDRWFDAAERAEGKGIGAFRAVDPELVDSEAERFSASLKRLFAALPDQGRALVVGHSPMHEVAVFGLTGMAVAPISKGGGALVIDDGQGDYRVEMLD
ncbi:MAG: histidine phosphatase family protein [Actinomycetota bacterium]